MKKGYEYEIEDRNILKKAVFLGNYFTLKGKLNFHTKEFAEIKWSKFPLYFFMSKEFGLIAFNSLKQFKITKELKKDKELSIEEINSLIVKERERKENSLYNNIFIDSIIKIAEKKETFS